MAGIGIVAEFNPLHKGHEYLLKEAKKHGTVVCVISGNFVQRGDTAIAEKRIRALAALKAGADLVLELPVLWSMSTAQNFALGAISALKYAGCEKIMFGSECGDITTLHKTADILSSDEFSSLVSKKIESGITFAAARQSAAEELGAEKGILEGANNNLGLEYILAARKIGFNPEFITISRKGAAHDSKEEDVFVSASLLREKLLKNDYDFCKKYMSEDILSLFAEENLSDINQIETAILAILRSKTQNMLKNLPDLSEGLENKLFSAISLATNLEELYNTIKVKRYTKARIRRLVLSAFIGTDDSFFMKPLPYLRVLGFNKSGEAFMRENLKRCEVPVINRIADTEKLNPLAKSVFETEAKATDLYLLSLQKPQKCGLEYTSKIIKTEN